MFLIVVAGVAFIAGFGLGRRGPHGPDPEMGPEWVARMYAEDHAVVTPRSRS